VVDPTAYVAPTAVLCGDVHLGAESRVLFGAVLTAEDGRIDVGARCVIMENALVRGRASSPVVVGDDVLIGPHVHVNGATVGDGCFLATGSSVFPNSRLNRVSKYASTPSCRSTRCCPLGPWCRSGGSRSVTRPKFCRPIDIARSGRSKKRSTFRALCTAYPETPPRTSECNNKPNGSPLTSTTTTPPQTMQTATTHSVARSSLRPGLPSAT
jgi:hypothetical protein